MNNDEQSWGACRVSEVEAQLRSLQSSGSLIKPTSCAVSCLRHLLVVTRLAESNDQVSHSRRQGLQQAEICLASLPHRSHCQFSQPWKRLIRCRYCSTNDAIVTRLASSGRRKDPVSHLRRPATRPSSCIAKASLFKFCPRERSDVTIDVSSACCKVEIFAFVRRSE